jgi:hypothetical protein
MPRRIMPDPNDEQLEFTFEGENLTIAFDHDYVDEYVPNDDDDDVDEEEEEGFNCIHCGEFYPYGKINQSDGTFKCWGCRH